MKLIVLDNSSATFLAKMGLFKLLLKHFKVITTKEVYGETLEGIEKGYKNGYVRKDLIDKENIKIIKPKIRIDEQIIRDKTDNSIVSLAKEKKAIVLTEDNQIANYCRLFGIENIKITTLIFYFYKKNELKRDQSLMLLDLLERYGYNKYSIITIKEKIIKGD